ncbi:MAG: hypothetical protein ACP5I4_09600 [Oceanipulchritudo sp.]
MEFPRHNHTVKLPPETDQLLQETSAKTDMYHAGVIGNGLRVWYQDFLHRPKEVSIPDPSPSRKHKTINFNLEDYELFTGLLKHYGKLYNQWQIIHGAIWLTSQGYSTDKSYHQRSVDELASVSTNQLIRALELRGYRISKR